MNRRRRLRFPMRILLVLEKHRHIPEGVVVVHPSEATQFIKEKFRQANKMQILILTPLANRQLRNPPSTLKGQIGIANCIICTVKHFLSFVLICRAHDRPMDAVLVVLDPSGASGCAVLVKICNSFDFPYTILTVLQTYIDFQHIFSSDFFLNIFYKLR